MTMNEPIEIVSVLGNLREGIEALMTMGQQKSHLGITTIARFDDTSRL